MEIMITSLFSFFSYLFFLFFFLFFGVKCVCVLRIFFFSTAISSSDDTEPSSKAENRD